MRAAIYVRVSTDDQAKSGYSLPDQISTCKTKLLEMGITDTVEYIDDGYSGEFIDRPALTRMRADMAHRRIDLVIVYDPDRLARNLSIQLLIANELETAQIPIYFITGNYDASPEGKLFFSMRGAIAEYEKAKILDRTTRGKRRKSSEGKIIQDFGLYGYDYDPKTCSYIINEEESKVIRTIYTLFLDLQLSIGGLQRELKKRVIQSPTGKALWPTSSLHNLLTNQSYTGTFVSMQLRHQKTGIKKRMVTERPENERIPIPVPVIIGQKTFDRVQKQLQKNKAVHKHPFTYYYLVSGIIYCGLCGRRMLVHHNQMPNGTFKSYYQCAAKRYSNLRNAGVTCEARAIPAEIFDKGIWKEIVKTFNNPEYIKRNTVKEEIHEDSNELERFIKLESELIKKRETITRWFRQKMVSETEAEIELLQIKTQLEDIQKRKAAVTRIRKQPKVSFNELCSNFQEIALGDTLTNEQKKFIITSIFSKILVIRKDNRSGILSTRTPPEFRIKWELN